MVVVSLVSLPGRHRTANAAHEPSPKRRLVAGASRRILKRDVVRLTGGPRLLELRQVGSGRADRSSEANYPSECAHVLRFQ